ncbi:hypothetical protein GUJ93_ZPchr0006g44828 [Zizania palustris]|uniref:Uncharacterized protein n=1 Tax=Zizania palustris TaxID=103762 RepID=A0A8J5W294_ZIZPA|nr:hypothetical protein GUJ93_ZPchr0006g44828 [Zizania palustris]
MLNIATNSAMWQDINDNVNGGSSSDVCGDDGTNNDNESSDNSCNDIRSGSLAWDNSDSDNGSDVHSASSLLGSNDTSSI